MWVFVRGLQRPARGPLFSLAVMNNHDKQTSARSNGEQLRPYGYIRDVQRAYKPRGIITHLTVSIDYRWIRRLAAKLLTEYDKSRSKRRHR